MLIETCYVLKRLDMMHLWCHPLIAITLPSSHPATHISIIIILGKDNHPKVTSMDGLLINLPGCKYFLKFWWTYVCLPSSINKHAWPSVFPASACYVKCRTQTHNIYSVDSEYASQDKVMFSTQTLYTFIYHYIHNLYQCHHHSWVKLWCEACIEVWKETPYEQLIGMLRIIKFPDFNANFTS